MVRVANLKKCETKTVVISLKNGLIIKGDVFITKTQSGFVHPNEEEIGLKNISFLREETPKIQIPSTIIINIDDISMYGIAEEFETTTGRL